MSDRDEVVHDPLNKRTIKDLRLRDYPNTIRIYTNRV
jgi:hypothetical protein